MWTSSKQTLPAFVPNPEVLAKVNESVYLACKAFGRVSSLGICFWERNVTGRREVIIRDLAGLENSGRTSMEGVTLVEGGFESGSCDVNIKSLKAEHFGRWSYTLVTQAGSIFTGDVSIIDGNTGGTRF